MRYLVLCFVTALVCSLCTGGDREQITAAVYKLQADRNAKESILLKKLISGLQAEEKEAQKAGKLELVLAIRARLAELDVKQDNPFGAKEANESVPVAGSASEKAYATGMDFTSKEYQGKINLIKTPLEAKKQALTKAGKIQEALDIEEIIVSIDPDAVNGIVFDQIYFEKFEHSREWFEGDGLWLFAKNNKCYYLKLGGKEIVSADYKTNKDSILITSKIWAFIEVTPMKDNKLKLVRAGKNPSELSLADPVKYEKEITILKNKTKLK